MYYLIPSLLDKYTFRYQFITLMMSECHVEIEKKFTYAFCKSGALHTNSPY